MACKPNCMSRHRAPLLVAKGVLRQRRLRQIRARVRGEIRVKVGLDDHNDVAPLALFRVAPFRLALFRLAPFR